MTMRLIGVVDSVDEKSDTIQWMKRAIPVKNCLKLSWLCTVRIQPLFKNEVTRTRGIESITASYWKDAEDNHMREKNLVYGCEDTNQKEICLLLFERKTNNFPLKVKDSYLSLCQLKQSMFLPQESWKNLLSDQLANCLLGQRGCIRNVWI